MPPPFHPRTLYSCGPTTYAPAHLGHLRVMVTCDAMRRALGTVWACNVTDVDDKIIAAAPRVGASPAEFAAAQEREFWECMRACGVPPPCVVLRVTEHVPEIIATIARLIDLGMAHVLPGGEVRFDCEAFRGAGHAYGRLSPWRPPPGNSNFTLWKPRKASDEPAWDSPWGPGRPGWHVECTTMAREAFGPRLDLHLGGEDLCFPHHENELALATALDGSEGWCDAFRHVGKVTLGGGGKMSKSDGTAVDACALCAELGPRVLRLWFLSHRWTDPLAYEGPERIRSAVARLDGGFAGLAGERARESLMHRPPGRAEDPFSGERAARVRAEFRGALDEDFDTVRALSVLADAATECMRAPRARRSTWMAVADAVLECLRALGIEYPTPSAARVAELDAAVRARARRRASALSTSNRSELAWCDTERARLAGEGARVRDPGETWSLSCDAGGPGPTTRVPSV